MKNSTWQPNATLEILKQRAAIIATIRQFFAERNVLEVDTPLMCQTSVTDPFIASIPTIYQPTTEKQLHYYLQTSPEYAMKRLLAAGSGSIYQICKAFRQGEVGRFHNPEFMMLEWYRLGFDHHALMHEMDELLQRVLHCPVAEKITYRQLFLQYLQIDPVTVDVSLLQKIALQQGIDIHDANEMADKDTWLMILMSHLIEPQLGKERPCFIYHFPATQAALAKLITEDGISVAARFEVYIEGIELANGFYELQDANEQRARFLQNQKERKKLGLPEMQLDENFLAALAAGFPDCAGVALGIDRLIMLATKLNSLQDILSFAINRV